MGLHIVCHGCGHVLYDGIDIIPFYKLRQELDNKCPNCKRKLAIHPISVELKGINFDKNNSPKM
ncbi:MAG: hypothetical protein NUK62_08730 [Tenericutes bacterium]|nr:hypothetical protein [Mycoplasmatota bacterium]